MHQPAALNFADSISTLPPSSPKGLEASLSPIPAPLTLSGGVPSFSPRSHPSIAVSSPDAPLISPRKKSPVLSPLPEPLSPPLSLEDDPLLPPSHPKKINSSNSLSSIGGGGDVTVTPFVQYVLALQVSLLDYLSTVRFLNVVPGNEGLFFFCFFVLFLL